MVSAVGIGGLAHASAKERLNAPLLSRWPNNRDTAAQAALVLDGAESSMAFR